MLFCSMLDVKINAKTNILSPSLRRQFLVETLEVFDDKKEAGAAATLTNVVTCAKSFFEQPSERFNRF